MNTTFNYKYLLSAADTDISQTYYWGLGNVLKKYGVDTVILNTVEYQYLEDTYIILAKTASGQVVGGIRVEIKTDHNKLPIEKLNTPYQNLLNTKIKNFFEAGKSISELSGLWVENEIEVVQRFKGKLGPELCKRAFNLALGLNVDYVLAMPPLHTKDLFLSLGFMADPDIPPMAYPDDRYISTILWGTKTKELTVKNQAHLQKDILL